MSDPFPPPGEQPPPPPPPPPYGQPPYGQPPYGQPQGYQQQGYGYSYGSSYSYAGFWRRFAAALLDGLILSVPNSLINAAVGGGSFNATVGYGISPGQQVTASLLTTALGVVYYAYFEGTRGQTFGKMALGIRVIDAETGMYIGIGRGVGRYFARWLSAIAIGLGYLWMLWDPRKQCWHDKLVNDVVVHG